MLAGHRSEIQLIPLRRGLARPIPQFATKEGAPGKGVHSATLPGWKPCRRRDPPSRPSWWPTLWPSFRSFGPLRPLPAPAHPRTTAIDRRAWDLTIPSLQLPLNRFRTRHPSATVEGRCAAPSAPRTRWPPCSFSRCANRPAAASRPGRGLPRTTRQITPSSGRQRPKSSAGPQRRVTCWRPAPRGGARRPPLPPGRRRTRASTSVLPPRTTF